MCLSELTTEEKDRCYSQYQSRITRVLYASKREMSEETRSVNSGYAMPNCCAAKPGFSSRRVTGVQRESMGGQRVDQRCQFTQMSCQALCYIMRWRLRPTNARTTQVLGIKETSGKIAQIRCASDKAPVRIGQARGAEVGANRSTDGNVAIVSSRGR